MVNFYVLPEIASHAVWEIDNYAIGRCNNFNSVKSISRMFEEDLIKKPYPKINFSESTNFYVMLSTIFEKNSNKKIKNVSELALEIRLLQTELNSIQNLNKERLDNLKSFFLDLSKKSRNYLC